MIIMMIIMIININIIITYCLQLPIQTQVPWG